MIIDVHTHVGENKFVKASIPSLQKEMEKNGVNYSVCFPLGEHVHENSMKLLREKPKNMIAFLRIDPRNTEFTWVRKHIHLFSGVKLHPRVENFDPLLPSFDELFRIIQKSEKPVLIHTRKENNPNSDPDRLVELALRYPQINFIFGHFANGLDSVIKRAKDIENLFLETSIVSSPKIIEMAVNVCGSEKILFGSDYPYSDQELELEKVKRAEISREARENILSGNARRIIPF